MRTISGGFGWEVCQIVFIQFWMFGGSFAEDLLEELFSDRFFDIGSFSGRTFPYSAVLGVIRIRKLAKTERGSLA